MGKVTIKDPERFRALLRTMGERVKARMEESIADTLKGNGPMSSTSVASWAEDHKPLTPDVVDEWLKHAARPSVYDEIFAGAGFGTAPRAMPFDRPVSPLKMMMMSYPIMVPSSPRIMLDVPDCDALPTLRAEITLPDSDEFRRVWRLWNVGRADRRRVKRVLRLFKRLIAQAHAGE